MFGFATLTGNAGGAFNPKSLKFSQYWRASYIGAPWLGTSTAGTSNTTNPNLINGNAGPPGPAQNGFTPANFSTSGSASLANASHLNYLFSTSGTNVGTFVCVFQMTAILTSPANFQNEATIMADTSGNFGVSVSQLGVRAYMFQGASTLATVISDPGIDIINYHIMMARFDGTTLGVTVDALAEVTTPSGNIVDPATGTLGFGVDWQNASFLDANILEIGTSSYTWPNSDYTRYVAYAKKRYNI